MSCDGLGDYDWSDHAEEGPNFAFMAYASSSSSSDSEVSNDSSCLYQSCVDTLEELKSRNESLRDEVEKLKLDNLGYKFGLKSIEEKLDFLKKKMS